MAAPVKWKRSWRGRRMFRKGCNDRGGGPTTWERRRTKETARDLAFLLFLQSTSNWGGECSVYLEQILTCPARCHHRVRWLHRPRGITHLARTRFASGNCRSIQNIVTQFRKNISTLAFFCICYLRDHIKGALVIELRHRFSSSIPALRFLFNVPSLSHHRRMTEFSF